MRAKSLISIALFFLTACSSNIHTPDLQTIYNRTAKYHGPDRNPVIVIPGILGSKLQDSESGLSVWGIWDKNYADPNEPTDVRLISLPLESPIREQIDSVEPNGSLDKIKISIFGFIPVEVNAYRKILGTLGVGGYRDETLGLVKEIDYGDDHYTCFQFAYDWRQSSAVNAQRLHKFILEKRKYIQEQYKKDFGLDNYDVKFDIVAHSMGGLVARYYLRYGDTGLPEDGSLPKVTWEGTKHVERALLVGTPNGGSILSLHDLILGKKLAPFIPHFHAGILGTLPSIYELIPRTRHHSVVSASDSEEDIDVFDIETWKRYQWGLADPKQSFILDWILPNVTDTEERRKIGLERLRASLVNAKQFHAALDQPATLPPGFELSVILGDAEETREQLAVDADGKIQFSKTGQGDGLVLRSSALMDERVGGDWSPRLRSPIPWHSVMFIFRDHIGLTEDPAFSDNVLYYLLEKPRVSPIL